ncbi:S41 family peptidase [Empedobacter brevis]|uniref:S41 family peptidase n=1 Tax=Empedobacter brevis TaxID=247 RepID=UPI002897D524|nr:S41 family peptidase [Empedobacter brevis]
MNLKFLIPIITLTINFAFAQNAEVKNVLLEKTLKKDSIISEFTELYNLTNTIHPGQFMFCSKNEFDKTYLNLKNSIKSDLSVVEYYKLTATLMAKIKDGHTAVDRTQIIKLLNDRLVFPFSVYKINNNYYLYKSTSENNEYVGLQIVKINGKEINSIVKEIRKFTHLEGENETGLNTRFNHFPFYYFIFNQTDKFQIEYIDKNNHKQKKVLKGITFETYTKSIAENITPLQTEFKTNNLAVLKFHSFANGYDETNRKIAEKQLDNFFTQLDSLKTKNLIIDLRDNSGGSADIASYLFSYLTNKPFYYLDYQGSNYYKGNISVLINGGCFSTTGHLLALLREYKIGKFYGEYSQGNNYSNAGGQAFVLPYSKTLVWIPTFQYKMKTPNFEYDTKGIKPDIEIQIEPTDLKTKFDRQMEYVIKKIEQNK